LYEIIGKEEEAIELADKSFKQAVDLEANTHPAVVEGQCCTLE
jgi:hypothetical protein